MSSTNRNSVIGEKAIFPDVAVTGSDDVYDILDEGWVRTSFLVSDSELEDENDVVNRYWSTASGKFTDSSLGGNFGINNAPQYTPYADYPVPGRLAGRAFPAPTEFTSNYGWGDYYSMAVDDTRQTIFMRFGVPQFNSLFSYFTGAFDTNQSLMARTGRMPSLAFKTGKLLGTFLAVTNAPVIALTVLAARVISYFFNRSTSKFYTLRPTMYMYWSTVNTLANTLAVNIGIYPKITGQNKDDTQRLGRPMVIDQDYLETMTALMPDIFSGSNYFDIHAIANRAQRISNQIHTDEFRTYDTGTPTDFTGYLKKEMSGDGRHSSGIMDKKGKYNLSDLIDETLKVSQIFGGTGAPEDQQNTDPRAKTSDKDTEKKSWLSDYGKLFDAEFRMGSQFAAFNVDYTGPQTTSFASQTAESQISQKLNNFSSNVREARFAMAEGNVLGGLVKSAMDSVTDMLSGFIAGATFDMSSFVSGILGDGFVDIPEHWMNSSAQLPEASYTMTLTATYNTPMSRMMKLYIPIAMLMAAALPRSIGKQSYTSPFLCQVFDKGRAQVRLGIIKSLSITSGSGANIGFDHKGNPLSFDVSFTIADLSSVMHMPVSSGEFWGVDMTLDEDNILSDYLSVLTSQDIYSQIYPSAQARLRLAKLAINAGKWSSPAFWAAATHDTLMSTPVGYVLESLVRGSDASYGKQ